MNDEQEDDKAFENKVTAARRPLNSALEVDLDFEHNERLAPIITEEVTATLEDLIKKGSLRGSLMMFKRLLRCPVKHREKLKR
ncbi:M phase phosphoprotein 10-like [Corylus avellana]|uniref:M phase phosphoprotein 10-like n=1 Tax=Corylus avellana TaxID=13451 RepID=UPI00286C148D|nr:M phase phosphoprotein 10-like [Corylus avellana]